MFLKVAFLISCLAFVNAGLVTPIGYTTYNAPAAYTSYSAPTLTATSENVYRSTDNLRSISTQSKSIATPFSSSNKHDVRVTNPGIYNHLAPTAPLTYTKYTFDPVPHHHAYTSDPNFVYAKYAAAPPAHVHLEHHPHSAPVVAHGSSLLGVAYSPAVAVSHMTYSSPLGINYSW